jgi:hypothetical protein
MNLHFQWKFKLWVEKFTRGFASAPQAHFPAHNFNFHWRWLDRIQATFENLFYFTFFKSISTHKVPPLRTISLGQAVSFQTHHRSVSGGQRQKGAKMNAVILFFCRGRDIFAKIKHTKLTYYSIFISRTRSTNIQKSAVFFLVKLMWWTGLHLFFISRFFFWPFFWPSSSIGGNG